MPIYWQVAVNFPLRQSVLTYSQPESSPSFRPGQLVKVPLGKRWEKGCLIRLSSCEEKKALQKARYTIRSFGDLLFEGIYFSTLEIELFSWLSHYYHYSLGQLIFDCLPPLPSSSGKKSSRKPPLKKIDGKGDVCPPTPTKNQQHIIDEVAKGASIPPRQFLIHGVTGSGKSLIYLHQIKKVLAEGKSVLFLIPEINLSPQFLSFFSNHLCVSIFPYHSALTPAQKRALWNHLCSEESGPCLIIGARSAVFLPLKDLGLIIVDEEHDSSYKQEDRCPYHGRDVVLKKAQLLSIPTILGSATPSLETLYRIGQRGKLFSLKERPFGGGPPPLELLDCRRPNQEGGRKKKENPYWPLEEKSLSLLKKVLEGGEQALVFVNRLGHANYLQCKSCGEQFQCVNCSTTLRFFYYKNKLSCGHCSYSRGAPEICHKCNCLNIIPKGYGTEKVTMVLEQALPQFKVERFDREEVKSIKQLEDKLSRFEGGEVDVLVGTQMLSKGHDFKNVALVLILGIDSQLNYPDFRASERVFQQLVQVAGRAGRSGQKARVLVQTLSPENPLFTLLEKDSFGAFYEEEIPFRRDLLAPPFGRQAMVYLLGKVAKVVANSAAQIGELGDHFCQKYFPEVSLLGPRPSIIEKRVNTFTWCLLFQSKNPMALHGLLSNLQKNAKLASGVSLKIDMDPQTFH